MELTLVLIQGQEMPSRGWFRELGLGLVWIVDVVGRRGGRADGLIRVEVVVSERDGWGRRRREGERVFHNEGL